MTEQYRPHHMTRKAADVALAKRVISRESHRAVHEGRITLAEAHELGRNGSPYGPAPKPADKNDRSRLCLCGCGRSTGGRFTPGHDARVKGRIVRAVREGTVGELTDEQREYARERGLI